MLIRLYSLLQIFHSLKIRTFYFVLSGIIIIILNPVNLKSVLAKEYHIVKPGDNLIKIASKYNININDLLKINNISSSNKLFIGQKLKLASIYNNASNQQFITHNVSSHDTLYSISRRYNVAIKKICLINNIKNEKIFVGQRLNIPIGNVSTIFDIDLAWPIKGRIILPFGISNRVPHKGIDIACKSGSNVKASQEGEVKYVGFFRGLKNFIIIKHNNFASTVYGNLEETFVKVNQKVMQDEIIGTTVKSDNPADLFLHFEIRINTVAKNPIDFIKK